MSNHGSVISLLAAAALAATGTAQVTQHSVVVGGPDAVGCQNATVPPTLDDGVTVGLAQLGFTYDSSTHVLQLEVSNTSPVVSGMATPKLTQVYFNLPEGTVSSVTLLSQVASDGEVTTFDLAFDADLSTPEPSTKMGCAGYFNVCLSSKPAGIVNPSAANARAGDFEGPVLFELQLAGSGVSLIDAYTIAGAFSRNADEGYNAGVKFQAGGEGAEASGFISSAQPACIPTIWIDGPPRIGTTVNLCVGAMAECYGCLLLSLHPGPTQIGPYLLPIGVPLAGAIALPPFDSSPACFSLPIPDLGALVGESIYLTVETFPGPYADFEFSPALVFTFAP